MKFYLSLFLILYGYNGFSQDSTKTSSITKSFVKINDYRKLGHVLTSKDSSNLIVDGLDTLVQVNTEFLQKMHPEKGKSFKVRYEPRDSIFLETYKNIVFGKNENPTSTLKIWKDDIKIYFDQSVPDSHQKILMDFAEEVATEIDSLRIINVTSKDDSNYLVYYMNNNHDEDFEPRISKKSDGFFLKWNRKQQLVEASLKINTMEIKNQDYQIANLKFNFIRTLGYFGEDTTLQCESYFSTCPVIRNLTTLDMEILKYHYSYGICKGTNREDFEDLHRKMKETLGKHPNAKLFVVHKEL